MRPGIVLIGTGNLATQLSKTLKEKGFPVLQVYSRTQASAEKLACRLGCGYTDSMDELRKDAQIYVFAVKDAALDLLISRVSGWDSGALFLHTAGSVPMDIFKGWVNRYGVFYPMQTFTKDREVDFSDIPCFIEGSTEEVRAEVRQLSGALTAHSYELDSSQRRYLHLAAVFACNFVNHLFALSEEILMRQQIPFEVMYPLVEETVRKIRQLPPSQAQTGPALRNDRNVLEAHLDLLGHSHELQEIYRLLSRSIYEKARNNGKY